jgi:bacillithiol system protein YtxJ
MVQEVRETQDIERLVERSKTHPVLIFKHSTQCSISDQVYEDFTRFMETAGDTECGLVLVIERRAISNAIADRFGIRHESPQAIVLKDGKAVWNASHWSITAGALSRALYAESSHQ